MTKLTATLAGLLFINVNAWGYVCKGDYKSAHYLFAYSKGSGVGLLSMNNGEVTRMPCQEDGDGNFITCNSGIVISGKFSDGFLTVNNRVILECQNKHSI